jgi:hypothetical protein
MMFQIILILFASYVLWHIHRQYRARKVSAGWFRLWLFFWAVVIFVAVSPQTTDVVAKRVGIERGADMLVYAGLVTLFFALIRVAIRLEEHRREMTQLVRRLAMEKEKERLEREGKPSGPRQT